MEILSFMENTPVWLLIIPLVICSILLLGIIFERFYVWRKYKYDYRSLMFEISQAKNKNEILDKIPEKTKNPILLFVKKVVLLNLSAEELEQFISVESENILAQISQRTGIVATIATVSPMLGLLGTVTGLMKSFSAMEQATVVSKNLLASGIAEAMVTTAIGLVIAIPAVIFQNCQIAKLEFYTKELEFIATTLYFVLEKID